MPISASDASSRRQASPPRHEPVPIPWKLRWREFRIRIIPIIVFLLAFLAILWLWSDRVRSPDFVGRVMATEAVITSPSDGQIREIFVQNFDSTAADQPLFRLQRGLDDELRARIARVEAEIAYMRTSLYPLENNQRNYMDYQNLRLDWMEKQVEKATLKIRADQLERDLRRAEELTETGSLQPQAAEQIRAERNAARSQIQQLTSIIETLQDRFTEIERRQDFSTEGANRSLEASINTQLAEINLIEAELGSLLVRTPVSGRVQQMRKALQEYVRRGDTLAVVQAGKPEYIVGYLRQPFSVRPETGMKVELRSRSIQNERYEARISSLGAQIQPISADMQRPGMTNESGLPVKIELQPGLASQFTPGELIDLILKPD